MRIVIQIVLNLIVIAFLSMLYWKGIYLNLKEVVILYEISLTVSTILFGVIGIWISSIYAQNISNIGELSEVNNETLNDANYLIKPLLFCVFNISFCVFFFIFSSLCSSESFPFIIKPFLIKITTYGIVYILLIQCWYILNIFIPFFKLKINITKELEKKRLKNLK